ncbi:unnamed protein product [Protopolystoma xenopodis]|uniref:Uncharacterized protein n=1 Tax=Protopolystoma xenopodis TaxID=117903 RepID=A0A448WUP9_9PLAT|nr:unnamed protein product [Protopolystoma xenopodis]
MILVFGLHVFSATALPLFLFFSEIVISSLTDILWPDRQFDGTAHDHPILQGYLHESRRPASDGRDKPEQGPNPRPAGGGRKVILANYGADRPHQLQPYRWSGRLTTFTSSTGQKWRGQLTFGIVSQLRSWNSHTKYSPMQRSRLNIEAKREPVDGMPNTALRA